MKFYEIIIEPRGGSGTPLKGDTLFGHFCWQAAYDASLINGGLEHLLSLYGESPGLIFSSAFPKLRWQGQAWYALKRPDLPSSVFPLAPGLNKIAKIKARKTQKEKKWWLLPEDLRLDFSAARFMTDQELLQETDAAATEAGRGLRQRAEEVRVAVSRAQPHNTINRLSGTTGEGQFAPYTQKMLHYFPGLKLAIFVLLEENITDIPRVYRALEAIGAWGFGKDASIGQGRFAVLGWRELAWPDASEADAAYALAPSVPAPGSYQQVFFAPFIRFGKHGDIYARSGQPFKNPVLMADEGAVFFNRDRSGFSRPYLGAAVRNLSKALPATVMQGYTPYLPFKVEM